MAIFLLNGIEIQIKAPVSIEETVLTKIRRAESGGVRLSRHGDPTEARLIQVQTEIMSTSEKNAVEAELLASGPATISGDLFGTSRSAYVRPVGLRAGPLDDQWTWFFEVEEVGE